MFSGQIFFYAALQQADSCFGSSGPELCADLEEIAKTGYEMVVGERESFEDIYGQERPVITNVGGRGSILNEITLRDQW